MGRGGLCCALARPSYTLEGVIGGGYRHRRVRAGFQGLGFDGVGVSCDGETVRERVIRDGMLICMCEGINDGTRGGLEAGV